MDGYKAKLRIYEEMFKISYNYICKNKMFVCHENLYVMKIHNDFFFKHYAGQSDTHNV